MKENSEVLVDFANIGLQSWLQCAPTCCRGKQCSILGVPSIGMKLQKDSYKTFSIPYKSFFLKADGSYRTAHGSSLFRSMADKTVVFGRSSYSASKPVSLNLLEYHNDSSDDSEESGSDDDSDEVVQLGQQSQDVDSAEIIRHIEGC